MKKFKFRLISLFMCIALAVSAFPVTAATPSAADISGAQTSTSKALATGATHTQTVTSQYSVYDNRLFNIVEADLSDRNLYINTVYGGNNAQHAYITGTTNVKRFASSSGKTPVAAVNADLWWLYTGSAVEASNNGELLLNNSNGLAMALGFTMSNGEIYTSDRMPEESFTTTNGVSLHYEDYQAFGVTSDFVPVISNPNAQVTIKNNTKNITAEANGINRLPVNNTLVMYTDKGCLNNYANDDAFEVKILIDSTNDYVIKHGTSISGKVTEVHTPSSSTNPTMTVDSNYIILTARGIKYDSISSFAVGDKVSIDISVYDLSGKYTTEWQRVTDAVSGHIPFVKDGQTSASIPLEANYPATFIGINNSGHVVMGTVGATSSGNRLGIEQTDYDDLAADLDLRDAFLLDGGGSSTMIINNDGNYKVANSLAYGVERQLLNMLVISTGPERAAQGKIRRYVPEFNTPDNIDFTVGTNISYFSGSIQDTSMKPTPYGIELSSVSGYDPFASIDLEISSNTVYADDNRYIVMEYMMPVTNSKSTYETQIFYHTGTNYTSSEQYSVMNRSLICDGEYHVAVFDMNSVAGWAGKINYLRLDYFATCSMGDTMYVKRIAINSTGAIDNSDPYIIRKDLDTYSNVIAPYILNANSYNIYDGNGSSVNAMDNAGTNSLLNVYKGGTNKSYYIVILGDCTGDGSINIADAATAYNHIMGNKILSDSYLIASDYCQDDNVNILDVMKILNSI